MKVSKDTEYVRLRTDVSEKLAPGQEQARKVVKRIRVQDERAGLSQCNLDVRFYNERKKEVRSRLSR